MCVTRIDENRGTSRSNAGSVSIWGDTLKSVKRGEQAGQPVPPMPGHCDHRQIYCDLRNFSLTRVSDTIFEVALGGAFPSGGEIEWRNVSAWRRARYVETVGIRSTYSMQRDGN